MDKQRRERKHCSTCKCKLPSNLHLIARIKRGFPDIVTYIFLLFLHIEIASHGVTAIKAADIHVHLYFQKDTLDLVELKRVRFGSYAGSQSVHDLGSDASNLIYDHNIHNEITKTNFDELAISECEGTIDLDCFSIRLSRLIELFGPDSIQYLNDYHSFLSRQDNLQSFFDSDYFLRSLEGVNDETLSRLVKMEVKEIGDDIEFSSIEHLYEEAYTLSLYLPMISFLVINVFALLVGFAIVCSNTCEERRDAILQLHKENQNRTIRDASLSTEGDSIEEEIYEIDGLVLSLDASNDEGIEVKLAD